MNSEIRLMRGMLRRSCFEGDSLHCVGIAVVFGELVASCLFFYACDL